MGSHVGSPGSYMAMHSGGGGSAGHQTPGAGDISPGLHQHQGVSAIRRPSSSVGAMDFSTADFGPSGGYGHQQVTIFICFQYHNSYIHYMIVKMDSINCFLNF